jgi:hypothetical protein
MDKIVVMLGLIGLCVMMYNMITNSTSMLIVGLFGIILVLLFALASGVGRSQAPVVIKSDCDKPQRIQPLPKKNGESSCRQSTLDPAGICPNNYTNFTDSDGNTLCCASQNIDPYNHTCPASGPSGICSMAPGLEDIRSPSSDKKFYPLCQSVRKTQTESKATTLCPTKYPYYLQSSSSSQSYKCCSIIAGATATDCPNPKESCSNLFGSQTVFNSPDSCEAIKLQASITCPTGTTFNPKMKVTDPKTQKVIYVPACQGSMNTCYVRKVLNKCMELGGCSKLQIDRSLVNCEVYNGIFNERTGDLNSADISPINFFG